MWICFLPFPLLAIIVATSGDKNLTLPENQAKIFASTWPEDDKKMFSYHWEKMAGPEEGTLSGKNAKDIVLSEVRWELVNQWNT